MAALLMKNLLKKYKPLLIYDNIITEKDFDKKLDEWLLKMQDNQQSKNDFIWSLLNESLFKIAQNSCTEQELYHNQRDIYLYQFRFLNDESKDISNIQKLINQCDLNLANLNRLQMNVILITNGCCNECQSFDGNKNSLESELSHSSLPIHSCSRPQGCICCYGFEGIRDANGRLKIKQSY